jgi:hypothetical protein
MDKFNRDSLTDLDRGLKSSADATRPEFSPDLHERILAAIDDCEMLPLYSWSARVRRPLAIAASLLAIVTGGALAGYSLTGGFNRMHSVVPSSPIDNGQQVSIDSDLMERALAAADHWGWLDEDSRSEAAWFVADMPLDVDSSDAAMPEEDDAELGS